MSGFALSQEQTEAVNSDSDRLMIVAPPGCGKTEILAHRAAYLVDSLEKNQRVLALTFTNRARFNLEERLRAVLGDARTRRYIVVRNFHGFAAQIVLAHGRTISLRMEDLKLPKARTLRKAVVKVGGNESMLHDVERMLDEIKRHPFSDVEVLDALRKQPQGQGRQ